MKHLHPVLNRFIFFFAACFLLLSGAAFGQFNIGYHTWDDLSFIAAGSPLQNPLAGGFTAPQFSAIDLDQDGILDLLAYDREGNVLKPFLNGGTPNTVDYTYAPEYISHFPALSGFVLLRDFNCDQKMDIFTSESGGIAVYENTSTEANGLSFQLHTKTILAKIPGTNLETDIFVSPADIPSISDVNGDNLPDILTFEQGGQFLAYYRHTGDCNDLSYELASECYGGFSENESDNTVTLFQSCKGGGGGGDQINNNRHAGSTILSLDVTGNGLSDLILGDLSSTRWLMLENGGSLETASMVDQSPNYPSDQMMDLTIFPGAFHLDVNNDGVKDLLGAPNTKSISENFHNVWYYENKASSDADPVQFEFVTDRFLVNEMVEVGTGANPLAIDVDGDGLLDLLVGNYGYYTGPGNFSPEIAYFRNTGTETDPQFDLVTRNYDDLAMQLKNALYPTAGDLDNDGDQDLIIGDIDGNVHFFRNNGGAGNPLQLSLEAVQLGNIDVGQFAAPHLVDVDRDGDLDLLIGERSGTIRYHRNRGTPVNFIFDELPLTPQYGSIDVRLSCCTGYAAPFLIELQEPDQYYFLVGSENGKIYFYNENSPSASFTLVDSITTRTNRVSISIADLDNDNKPELILGEQTGGITILKKKFDALIGIHENTIAAEPLQVVPNPASEAFQLRGVPQNNELSVQVFSITGQLLWEKQLRADAQGIVRVAPEINVRGIFLVKVQAKNSVQVARWIRP